MSYCPDCAKLERKLAEARDEIERLNSPVLKSEWQQMVADLAAARAEMERVFRAWWYASAPEEITPDTDYDAECAAAWSRYQQERREP